MKKGNNKGNINAFHVTDLYQIAFINKRYESIHKPSGKLYTIQSGKLNKFSFLKDIII